jgi:hypothetical protein
MAGCRWRDLVTLHMFLNSYTTYMVDYIGKYSTVKAVNLFIKY